MTPHACNFFVALYSPAFPFSLTSLGCSVWDGPSWLLFSPYSLPVLPPPFLSSPLRYGSGRSSSRPAFLLHPLPTAHPPILVRVMQTSVEGLGATSSLIPSCAYGSAGPFVMGQGGRQICRDLESLTPGAAAGTPFGKRRGDAGSTGPILAHGGSVPAASFSSAAKEL